MYLHQHLHYPEDWQCSFELTNDEIDNNVPNTDIGVYLIWAEGVYKYTDREGHKYTFTNPMVYVGSGEIANRLGDHLKAGDSVTLIKNYFRLSNLHFAYLKIEKRQNESDDDYKEKYQGVENYLAHVYRPFPRPTDDTKYPNVTPCEIDLPEISPRERGIACESALNNWDTYERNFCAWARIQHEEDFERPQKGRR